MLVKEAQSFMSMLLKQPEYCYEFAGVTVGLQFPEGISFTESRSLAPFRVPQTEESVLFEVKLVERLPEPRGLLLEEELQLVVYKTEDGILRYNECSGKKWATARTLTEYTANGSVIYVLPGVNKEKIASKTIVNAIGAEHLAVHAGSVMLHSSYINWQGKAILFTAPSGTGKSTQAALWQQYMAAEIINGDRAAFCMENSVAVAKGVPFAGSSGICKNQTLPLAAIVYLKQAPENTLCRLKGFRAFRQIWEGCSVNTWDRKDVSQATAVLQEIVQNVPVYCLACTPDESAVSILAEELRRQENA